MRIYPTNMRSFGDSYRLASVDDDSVVQATAAFLNLHCTVLYVSTWINVAARNESGLVVVVINDIHVTFLNSDGYMFMHDYDLNDPASQKINYLSLTKLPGNQASRIRQNST